MRRGRGGGIRRTEDGSIESANLGADYTSEHEWGIKGLERDFALDKTAAPGVPRRTIRVSPEGVTWDVDENILFYAGNPWSNQPITLSKHAMTEIGQIRIETDPRYIDESEVLAGAWSDGDFGVRFPKSGQGRQDVRDLLAAFERLDIAFLFANVGNNPFARAGLNLVIVSRLPQEIVDDLAEKDMDRERLLAAAEATGIKARIDAANEAEGGWRPSHGYYALSPSWASRIKSTKDGPIETAYEVIFFLNPQEQQDTNSGYFTVEQLDQWLEGKGPIPGKQKGGK